jgi:hypothetical protein
MSIDGIIASKNPSRNSCVTDCSIVATNGQTPTLKIEDGSKRVLIVAQPHSFNNLSLCGAASSAES